MARPLIGLTSYGHMENQRYSLPMEYVQAVVKAGGVPILLPPFGPEQAHEWLQRLDGLVLSGGGDIAPEHYAGHSHDTLYGIDPDRDATELALARLVLEQRFPTFAICRGLQIVNTVLGGSLHVHLPEVYGDRVLHRLPPRGPAVHDVTVAADSRLAASLCGADTVSISSWHHQAVKQLGEGLQPVAWAADGVIEAVELPDNDQLIAVQWHPEHTALDDPLQLSLFQALVVQARNNQR